MREFADRWRFSYNEQFGLNLYFFRYRNRSIVPRGIRWEHFFPKRLNACKVAVFISDNLHRGSR